MSDFVPMTREELLTGQGRIGGGDPPIVGAPGRYGSDVLRTALAYLDRAERAEQEAARERARAEKWKALARTAPDYTRLVTTEAGDGIGWNPSYFAQIEFLLAAENKDENKCPRCDGKGWYSDSAHAPDCHGSCNNCPVEVQIQCGDCAGSGLHRPERS